MKTFEELQNMKNYAKKQYELADAQLKKASLDEAIELINRGLVLLREAKELLEDADVCVGQFYDHSIEQYTLSSAIEQRSEVERTIARFSQVMKA